MFLPAPNTYGVDGGGLHLGPAREFSHKMLLRTRYSTKFPNDAHNKRVRQCVQYHLWKHWRAVSRVESPSVELREIDPLAVFRWTYCCCWNFILLIVAHFYVFVYVFVKRDSYHVTLFSSRQKFYDRPMMS